MDSYIAWKAIQDTWTKQYQALGRTPSLAVQAFFDARNLFSRGQTLLLYQAKETTTGEYHVCIPSTTCDNLRQTLTKLMQQLDPGLPIPEWPSATCSYMEPIEFRVSDKNSFQRVFKKTKKANATATKLREAHEAWRYAAELARSPGEYVLCSIDIEAWEQDHSILLEIGWTLCDTRTDRYMDQHYLISSYRHLSNGRYVDDQSYVLVLAHLCGAPCPKPLQSSKRILIGVSNVMVDLFLLVMVWIVISNICDKQSFYGLDDILEWMTHLTSSKVL